MELAAARTVLGVTESDDWPVVRTAYRSIVRSTHPDIAGAGGVERTVLVNDAYRTLAIARREGRLGAVDAPTVSHQIVDDVFIRDGDTLVLSSTPSETFRRLVEATNALGEISFVDRSSAIFEAILHLADGTHASFVVSLQWRAHDATCEAFCTLEALERVESLDARGVLEQLAQFIPPDQDVV